MEISKSEQHPNLPSGEWEGLYKYPSIMQGMMEEGKMSFIMDFCDGGIIGFGSDPVGGYTWKGTYDIKHLTTKMTKSYTTHDIDYEGNIDENGIWGFWLTGVDRYRGTFHIWPKGRTQVEVAVESKSKSHSKSIDKVNAL